MKGGEEMKNIYFIKRETDFIDYDENIDCVVIATDEHNAYELAFKNGNSDWGEENSTLEEFERNTSIEHIGMAKTFQKIGVVTINNKGG